MLKQKDLFLGYRPQKERDYEKYANRFTLKCQLISLGLLMCMWILNQFNVFIVDKQIMSAGVFICFCIEVLTIVICHIFGDEKEWMKYVILFFSVVMSTVAGVFLTYHTLLASVLPLLYSMQYRKKRVVYYTYGLTILSMTAIVLGGYYIGVCDANMLLLTTSSLSNYVDMDTQILLGTTINTKPFVTLPLFFVMPRMILLLAMIPVMQQVVNIASKHAAIEVDLKRMGEMDQMTHLYNRNKYSEMIKEYFPGIEKIAVLFWDVNGLKITNDTMGHDAGDYMITIIAKTISDVICANRFAYRIGGDEFVMIIENPEDLELETVLDEWSRSMERMNQSSKIRLSASVGYALGKGCDIELIINEADQMMYENKKRQKSELLKELK